MNGSSAISAYRNVGAQSAVMDSTPHQLVLMLIDGAIEKTASAMGQMLHGEAGQKGRLISGSITIIDSLRASLDHKVGGELAGNLDGLYDYMGRRLLEGNLQNDSRALTEVISLLKEIREAWVAIPQDYRGAAPAAASLMSFARQ